LSVSALSWLTSYIEHSQRKDKGTEEDTETEKEIRNMTRKEIATDRKRRRH